MSKTGGTSGLNNYLQNNGLLSALSWKDSTSGPRNAPTWTSVCKINGEERGTGTGTHKHIARDNAADAALKSLTEESAS
ncbi:hypothetical protein Hypma_015995 [Hypsizygus marmoreus]|uniref:DRBM domain-containing protein n=1 Tax=Hypsizygus marmoreus TaxID=39966 RepID=A0A369KEV2_HYPMA|nr:hypothetical protein Hypma_015995 [Hypsizygus marmoreus]